MRVAGCALDLVRMALTRVVSMLMPLRTTYKLRVRPVRTVHGTLTLWAQRCIGYNG